MLMAIVMSKAELKRKNKRLKLWYKNMKLQFLNKDLDYILTMKEKDNIHKSISEVISKIENENCNIDEVLQLLKEINKHADT